MYAVIKTGGKQYRVKAGDLLVVEKLDGAPGSAVAFDEVLMLGEGADVVVGAPTVAGAVVKGALIETRKGDKIKVFKKIRRQGYRRTQGHRQFETVVRITGVAGEGKSETWDGVIDLTTRLELNARARGLAPRKPAAEAPVIEEEVVVPVEVEAEAAPAKKKAKAKTVVEAEVAAPVETAPVVEAAAEETPAEETPVEETHAAEAPADDVSAAEGDEA
jgi:large subunit ribosomal protein L21